MKLSESSLYHLLVRQDRRIWGRIVFTAVIAGLMQGGIIYVINSAAAALTSNEFNPQHVLLFGLFLATYGWASHFSTSQTIALTERRVFDTYVAIADHLRNMQLLRFERLGKGHIYSTLHTNTDIILETSKWLATVGAAIVLILFSALYIAWLSPLAFTTVVAFYGFGYFIYRSNLGSVRELLVESGEREKSFRSLFSVFLEGFKELRVSHLKRRTLYEEHVQPQAESAMQAAVGAEARLTVNNVFIQIYYYFLIAAIIFLLPRISDMPVLHVLQVAAVVLFTYGSMTRIVQSVPLILKAERAVGALQGLERELQSARDPSEPYSGRFARLRPESRVVRFTNVTFDYHPDSPAAHFQLGPLSLEIEPGEMLFIVGGNGSGKTTFMKLLAGLYAPSSGQIHLGDRLIDNSNYSDYRDLFAILFSDYYQFDRFFGRTPVTDAELTDALQTVRLEEHVNWSEGRLENVELSAGQWKRLALACTLLDDSPIVLLDEVAADLDPVFRQYFYESYLNQLRQNGRTVIAVSHDEKYFHHADRVIKLDAGRVES
ncbi:MAG TPA: ATP-binding cassette domain-containing protein [Xanthomonadales bacterium]|nr:ATP-binding cassette domain-containing protein [Xanthomonadales bacterium]